MWLGAGCRLVAVWLAVSLAPGSDLRAIGEPANSPGLAVGTVFKHQSPALRTSGDLQFALAEARREIALGRGGGGEHHYAAARAALAPWWLQERPPAEALLLRAILKQHEHDFQPALADLRQLLAREPGNAQAWLTQAVVLRELGEYDRALASCLPLLQLASTLVATTCTSSVASRHGRARDSYAALHRALTDSAGGVPVERAWSLATLAEIAAGLDWIERADLHFRQALAFAPDDPETLAAYREFRRGAGRDSGKGTW